MHGSKGRQQSAAGEVRHQRYPLIVFAIAIGVACAVLTAAFDSALERRLPGCADGAVIDARVRIETIGEAGPRMTRVVVQLVEGVVADCVDLAGRRLRLNWYGAPPLVPGQFWRIGGKVRAPRTLLNPGGFDYARWLLANGYDGTGYVRSGNLLHGGVEPARERMTRAIRERVGRAGLADPAAITALATGSASELAPATWDRLRATGTVHLFVVSGLHIGLATGLGFALGSGLDRMLAVGLGGRRRHLLALALAAAFGGGYAWLSGHGVPASRALVMALVGLAVWRAGRRVPLWSAFLLAAVLVVGARPLAVLTQGFWLSFGAVGVLLLAFSARHPRPGWVTGIVLAQAVLGFALTPLLASLVGEVATGAAGANLVAVPVVSVLVVPLVLAGVVAMPLAGPIADWAWFGADRLLTATFAWLALLESLPVAEVGPGAWSAGGALAAAWLALRQLAHPGAFVLLPLWCAWLLPGVFPPGAGELRVIALDVGQGSAVIVDTHRHRLLYDTGARFGSGFDLGEAVVVPSLAATGPRRLDLVVVSHDDTDHAGGLGAVLAAIGARTVIDQRTCHDWPPWSWDGVAFEFLRGTGAHGGSDNHRSCVLAVEASGRRVLLAGDIDRRAEAGLRRLLDVPVDVLLVPHHGSRTSSSPGFVRRTRPYFAWVSAGLDNAYGHPHPEVVARYLEVGARVCVTGTDGALQWLSSRPRETTSGAGPLPCQSALAAGVDDARSRNWSSKATAMRR
jgi:competence protein ComEC